MSAMTARERILARRAGIAANRSKGLKPYKFKGGTTSFRILPLSTAPGEPFERKYGKTYLKSFDGQNFFGIGDRSITYDEPSDPIRELIFDAMRQAVDPETKEHYRKMLASTRYIFNALILDDKDQSPTDPVLIEVSEGAFDSVMAQFEVWCEDNPDYDLASLADGHVFKVEKSGQGLDTKYTFTATPKKAPLNEKILEKVIDLDAWIQSQFEGLEAKALEFLGRLNGAAGITTNAGLLTAAKSTAQIATNATSSTTPSNVSTAAVTTVIDDEDTAQVEVIEDAVIEDTPAADDTPVVEPETAQAAAAPADSNEIDDILASLS